LSGLLESLINSCKITKRLLFVKQKHHIIIDLNEQALKQLAMLLKPFKTIMTAIQCGNAPSLYLGSMFYIILKDLLGSDEELKEYNNDNSDQDEQGENTEVLSDDDLEHELPGKFFKINSMQKYY